MRSSVVSAGSRQSPSVRSMLVRPAHGRAMTALASAVFLAACSRGEPPRTASPSHHAYPQARPSPPAPIRSAHDPETGSSASQRVVAVGSDHRIPKGGGRYKLGVPYKISGRWYTPHVNPAYDRTGIASWYGDAFHGRKTANGEIYDMMALSAAHPTLPLPSLVWVTNVENGRTMLVRVNDRGPYADDRVIDLSRAVARTLGSEGRGLASVRVRYAGPAPLDGDDSREQAHLRGQPWFRSVGHSQPPPNIQTSRLAR